MSQGIVDELQSMKALIEDRFNTLTWLGQSRQNPIQSNLMLKLIRAGYSPTLARTILERMPEEMGPAESVRWVMDILERNLKTDATTRPLHEEGGTYALVGSLLREWLAQGRRLLWFNRTMALALVLTAAWMAWSALR